jgi:sortase A
VTTPRFRSEEALEHWSDARIDAWALCAEFVERIVSKARAEASNGSSEDIPEVDWAAIWRTGDGAPSDEVAIGRIVRAASDAAQDILRKQHGAPGSSPSLATGAGVVDAPPLAGTAETGPDTATAAEPSDEPIRAGAVRVEAPSAQPDQSPAPVDLAVSVGEPITVPLVVGAPSTPPGDTPAPSDLVASPAEPGAVPLVAETAATPPDEAAAPADLKAPHAEPLTAPLAEPVAADALTSQRPEPPTAQVGVAASEAPLIVLPALGDESDPGALAAVPSGEARTDSPWFHVFTWTAVMGAIILLFLVWQLWGTSISQHHAQNQLKSEFQALEAQHSGQSHGSKSRSLIPAATRVASPANGSVVAEIQIPAIGVDQYVVEGTADSDLSKGPGHYVGTAMPGQAGNVAIAGHRTTNGAPFNGLGHLVVGDRIILTTVYGQSFTYVVSGTPQAVSPSDVGVLNYFGDNRVTLTTCNPEFSSTQRLVVVGKLNQPGASPGVPDKNLSYHLANPATASWNWSLLPAVGVAVSLLVLLALSYRRFGVWFAGIGKWFVLVPLWAAGLYFLFTTLTNFLPAAL